MERDVQAFEWKIVKEKNLKISLKFKYFKVSKAVKIF